ncbi:MAG: hypothetical protein JXA24_04910 [Proteobacteria bacterium]|nr:hypothetical protein [Pseudomonadota bacterium]
MGEEIVVEQFKIQEMPPAFAGMGIGMIVVALAVYVFWAYCIARMAVRLGMPMGKAFVWALIPIANIFLLLKLSGKPMWWFILLLIPIVNIVIMILMWMAFVERLGHPAWWGVVIALVPVVNIVLFLILAFEKPQAAAA